MSPIYAVLGGLIFMQDQQPVLDSWLVMLILVVVLILVLWLVLRLLRGRTSPAAQVYPERKAAPLEMDNLEIIEGIGPKIAAVLNDAGIRTFRQLAATSPEEIKQILVRKNLRLADPHSWPEQARMAAEGDMASLQAYQEQLTAGR